MQALKWRREEESMSGELVDVELAKQWMGGVMAVRRGAEE